MKIQDHPILDSVLGNGPCGGYNVVAHSQCIVSKPAMAWGAKEQPRLSFKGLAQITGRFGPCQFWLFKPAQKPVQNVQP